MTYYDFIFKSLGVGMEDTILIVTLLGSLVMFAKDLRIGLMFLFIMTGAEFMLFYSFSMDYVKALIIFLSTLVLLALSLLIGYGKSTRWIV